MHSSELTVQVFNYDGTEHRRWHAQIVERKGALIVLEAQFAEDVSHRLLGEIKRGTRTVEYYWLDRWYNVFRFLQADESTRLYYCNINLPPTLQGDVLSYIDLDIDVLVQPDLSFQVLDLDEFAENAERYEYSSEERMKARAALDELIGLIRAQQFPFASLPGNAPGRLSANIKGAN